MVSFELPLVANVAEPGDIVLVAFVLVLTLLVGLALVGVDSLVGRLRRGPNTDDSLRTRPGERGAEPPVTGARDAW